MKSPRGETGKFAHISLLLLGLFILAVPVSAINVTAADPVTILPPDQTYIQFEIWVCLFALVFIFLALSLWPGIMGPDLWAGLAFVFSAATAYLSTAIQFQSVSVIALNETDVLIQPVSMVAYPPYLPYMLAAVTLISIVNVVRVVWEVYLKPRRNAKYIERGETPPMD